MNTRACNMNLDEKHKLKHDFLNSIVIINSMTKSVSSSINKRSVFEDRNELTHKQIEKFLYSMHAIREQTAKIEKYFQIVMNE